MLTFTFKGNLKKPVNGLSATKWRGPGGELVSLHNLPLSCFIMYHLDREKTERRKMKRMMPFDVIKSSKPSFSENCN